MFSKSSKFTKAAVIIAGMIVLMLAASYYSAQASEEIPVQNFGWVMEDNSWHYINEDGSYSRGWLNDYGVWYYFGNDGTLRCGWQQIGFYWYYFESDGAMHTGWLQSGDDWYLFGSGGVMQTGWVPVDGAWYYFNSDGVMQTGWTKTSAGWYYILPDGRMAADCWVSDSSGIPCYISKSGQWISGGLTWIGDSLSANMEGRIAVGACFYSPDVYSKSNRRIYDDLPFNPSGLSLAEQITESGQMNNTLVFALGTNIDSENPDMSYSEKINQLINIVGTDTKIVLVTAYAFSDDYTAYYYGEANDQARYLAAANPNISLADWAAVCDVDADTKDGVHPNSAGSMKFMQLIQQTLVSGFGAR